MKFMPQQLVQVFYNGTDTKLIIGRLLLKDRKLFFEYDSKFIKTGLELSPFKLPLRGGVIVMEDRMFEGLFGVFNDSLPDGWGRLLLDRKLIQMGFNPGMLSPLDRLCFVGHGGMGALSYEPENPNNSSLIHENLDEIYAEIQSF
jgi:serine/threonine-protein kinase HipA